MPPILSFIATLGLLGVVFVLLHLFNLWLNPPDIVALLLFALPVVGYVAYCTEDSIAQARRAATRIYLGFATVVLTAAGLVFVIG